MEFYLLNKSHLEMIPPGRGGDPEGKLTRRSKPMAVLLEPVVPLDGPVNLNYCEFLADALVENVTKIKGTLEPDVIIPGLTVEMTLPTSVDTAETGTIQIYAAKYRPPNYFSGCSIFERLKETFGVDNVKINLNLTCFNYLQGDDHMRRGQELRATDLAIEVLDYPESTENGCEFKQVDFSSAMKTAWKNGKTFQGQLTVTVALNHDALSKLYLQNFCSWDLHDKNKFALEEAICSDLVIVAANGVQVKCHKVYLASSSTVFKAMFESEMMEAATNSVPMSDMSEAGVRALLAFIYHWDLKEASRSCGIALELYQAGHKYHIDELENAMQALICSKPNEWFSVDMAVKLALFTKNRTEEEGGQVNALLRKGVRILKWYGKTSSENLLSSAEYRNLFENNPRAAMELGAFFLTFH